MTASSLPTAADAEAVRRVLHTYTLAVDSCDCDLLRSVFTPDVVLHRVDGPRTGRDAVLEFYRSVFDGPVGWSVHLVTNVLVDRAADGLVSQAAFHSAQLSGETLIDIYGRYRHRFVDADADGLRIAEKWIDVQQVFRRAAA